MAAEQIDCCYLCYKGPLFDHAQFASSASGFLQCWRRACQCQQPRLGAAGPLTLQPASLAWLRPTLVSLWHPAEHLLLSGFKTSP